MLSSRDNRDRRGPGGAGPGADAEAEHDVDLSDAGLQGQPCWRKLLPFLHHAAERAMRKAGCVRTRIRQDALR